MLEEARDRDQLVAGLVFAATFVVAWPLATVMRNKTYGLVLASILAFVGALLYYGYRWVLRHEQRIKEELDEHRYRFERLQEALERAAEASGANAVVARIDGVVERLVRRAAAWIDERSAGEADGAVDAVASWLDEALGGATGGERNRPPYGNVAPTDEGDTDRSDAEAE